MSEMYYPNYTQPGSNEGQRGHLRPNSLGRSVLDAQFPGLRDMIQRIEQMSRERALARDPHTDEALVSPEPVESAESGAHAYTIGGFDGEHQATTTFPSSLEPRTEPLFPEETADIRDDALVPVAANGHRHDAITPDPLAVYAVDYPQALSNGSYSSRASMGGPAETLLGEWSTESAPNPSEHVAVPDVIVPARPVETVYAEPSDISDDDRSTEEPTANAGRWWINFNGELSLSRVAQLRSRLQESPFVIEARFERIENGLVSLRVVTGGAVTTAQMDWVLRQLLESFELDEHCAILSPQ